jgi:hypothetical protein
MLLQNRTMLSGIEQLTNKPGLAVLVWGKKIPFKSARHGPASRRCPGPERGVLSARFYAFQPAFLVIHPFY